jgi:hypothetical protein
LEFSPIKKDVLKSKNSKTVLKININ